MVTIGKFAESYEPQKMMNIVDLDVVKTDMELCTEIRKDKDNEEYKVDFIELGGREYRVPVSVIEQLKAIIESKPKLKTFQVRKTGEGLATKYQVIPID